MQTEVGTANSKLVDVTQSYSNNQLAKKLYLNPLQSLALVERWIVGSDKNTATINSFLPDKTEQESSKIGSDSDNYLLRKNGYFIRKISSFKQRLRVNSLIKRRYASRGYNTDQTTVFSEDKDQITFEACDKSGQLGTLTLIIDLGKGLLADQHYQEEIDNFRDKETRVCEVSKLAFNPSSSSKEIFASLFHIAYLYAYCIYGVKNAFIEINPRHAAFYKRMLGFEQIGEERVCKRVDAPAVLLRLDLEYMRENIINNQTTSGLNNKSIYAYFLNQSEEQNALYTIQNQLGGFYKSKVGNIPQSQPLSLESNKKAIDIFYGLFTEIIKDGRNIKFRKSVYC